MEWGRFLLYFVVNVPVSRITLCNFKRTTEKYQCPSFEVNQYRSLHEIEYSNTCENVSICVLKKQSMFVCR
jgi:hypothetical protein